MTYDEIPEHTTGCTHYFKRWDCKSCYPPQYQFTHETPAGLPEPSSGWKM